MHVNIKECTPLRTKYLLTQDHTGHYHNSTNIMFYSCYYVVALKSQMIKSWISWTGNVRMQMINNVIPPLNFPAHTFTFSKIQYIPNKCWQSPLIHRRILKPHISLIIFICCLSLNRRAGPFPSMHQQRTKPSQRAVKWRQDMRHECKMAAASFSFPWKCISVRIPIWISWLQ